jgi:hypothetical protein
MIHHRQRLALGFKASDHLFGIHPQLDHFEGDATPDRLFLLCHIHHPTATLTDLLQQLVPPDAVADLFCR